MIHMWIMDWASFIDAEVHRHYWENDDTCAFTTRSAADAFQLEPKPPGNGG